MEIDNNVDNLSQGLTYELKTHLEAMEINHEELLRLLKTFMKMFAFMKFLATICGNLFGFEEKKTIK